MSHSILPCQVIGSTVQAVRVRMTDSPRCCWIPRSVIRDGDQVKHAATNIWVADWFIDKEDL